MTSRRLSTLTSPLIAVLLVSACSGGDPAEPKNVATTPGASARLTDWMADLCTANRPMMSATSSSVTAPQIADNPTEADRKKVKDFLRSVLSHVGKTKTALTALPPAPTNDSKKLLADYRKDVDSLYSKLFEYAEDAEWFPRDGVGVPYRLARFDLATFEGLPFQASTELTTAFRRTPACGAG